MKRLLFIVFAAAALVCRAQQPASEPLPSSLDTYMETGMEVEGVRAPYYDEEGNLQAQLYGGHVKVLEGDVADITKLRIDVYQDDVVVMTIFAPQCFSRMVEGDTSADEEFLSVYSEGDVLIDMESITISGRGFRFTSDGNRFEILDDSKVLVKESARDVKGVAL